MFKNENSVDSLVALDVLVVLFCIAHIFWAIWDHNIIHLAVCLGIGLVVFLNILCIYERNK